MLMKISEYRETEFTDKSKPSINTVKKWVKNGWVYGKVMGGIYYVDPEKTIPVNNLVNKVLSR
ncbi:MAG: hypothetical protein COA90_04110 [Gammaproteobacteria bacterium]|nr:MAG: hypothetical protein COA90_04110 [Gammaproteobacteria bacterium]